MKNILIVLVLMCASVLRATPYKPDNGWRGTIGFSAGQETFIGFPKLGIYKEFRRSTGNFNSGYRTCSFFVGMEGSAFVLIGAGAFSIDVNSGFSFGWFTVDNSLSRTIVTDPEFKAFAWYNSWNPKLGARVGSVWVKAGPSIWLSGNADWGPWMKIGNVPMNVEVHYVQKIVW